MLPTLKVYDIDYSFIIKNYLDVDLWQKTWTLFQYKDTVFTINLSSIDCKDNSICFLVKCNKLEYNAQTIWYYINSDMTIRMLINKINTAIWDLINTYERRIIRKTPEVCRCVELESEEESRLTEIANDFLDEQGVTNDDIRDAYISSYVSNNKHASDYTNDVVNNMKYTKLPDLYLVFAKVTKNVNRKQLVLNANKSNTDLVELLDCVDSYYNDLNDEDSDLNKSFMDSLEAI